MFAIFVAAYKDKDRTVSKFGLEESVVAVVATCIAVRTLGSHSSILIEIGWSVPLRARYRRV